MKKPAQKTPAPKKPAKKAKKRPRAPKPKAARPKAAAQQAPPAPAARKQTRTIDKRTAFLEAFAVCASVKGAAKAARIGRRQHYDWLKDPAYAARFEEMRIQAAQSVEDEIAERAMRGVYEPNVFQGRFIYPQEEVITAAVIGPRGGIQEPERREWRDVPGAQPFGVWKKSDTLLIHLSRGLMPEKYGMRGQFEVTGAQGGPIEIVRRLNAARIRAAQRNKAE